MTHDSEDYRPAFGGPNLCLRCKARSKRSGERCRAAAVRGKLVCRNHGGKSTGPRTEQGRARCAAAKTIHGRETRKIREVRREKIEELQKLEALARKVGLI